ncbi:MAG: hypothetical protein WC528_01130 [Patescibacteria group bacterium]
MKKPIPRSKSGLNIYYWPLIIFSGLIFVISFGAILYFGLNINKSELNISLTPQVIGEITVADNLLNRPERTAIFTRTGKVVALEDQTLYLESVYSQGDKIMKAVFKAEINPDAAIIKRDIDELSKQGPKATETTGTTLINLKDIRKGDTVTVYSASNIKDKAEFSVKKVEKRYSSDKI